MRPTSFSQRGGRRLIKSAISATVSSKYRSETIFTGMGRTEPSRLYPQEKQTMSRPSSRNGVEHLGQNWSIAALHSPFL